MSKEDRHGFFFWVFFVAGCYYLPATPGSEFDDLSTFYLSKRPVFKPFKDGCRTPIVGVGVQQLLI